MIQHFDLREIVLHDGDVTIRPCSATDATILKRWFGDDGIDRSAYRVVDEFTIWPFIIEASSANAGFLQVWRTNENVGGLEIFIAPEHRRKGVAERALCLAARHLREDLGWGEITIEPHSDDEPAIACFKKAGFVDRGERRDDGDHTHVILQWP